MNILYFRYNNICEPFIIDAFTTIGINLNFVFMNGKGIDSKTVETLSKKIDEFKPSAVFSNNFFPQIAKLCNIYGILYITLVIDSPVIELFHKNIQLDTNRIFIFDKALYTIISKYNTNNIFYIPLASNPEYFQNVIKSSKYTSESDISSTKDIINKSYDSNLVTEAIINKNYDSNLIKADTSITFPKGITFVGSLYDKKDKYNSIVNALTDYERGYIDSLINVQKNLYGISILQDNIPIDIADKILKSNDFFSDFIGNDYLYEEDFAKRYIVANEYLSFSITHRERIEIMNMLSKTLAGNSDVHLYTYLSGSKSSFYKVNSSPLFDKRFLNLHSNIDTLTQMPLVFNSSKINLNITLKSIQSGVPQRIFDIAACGGFVMTNYQEDLFDVFAPDKEIVYYENYEDLLDKCIFYLNHDDIRAQIASAGFERVCKEHTWPIRMSQILLKIFA